MSVDMKYNCCPRASEAKVRLGDVCGSGRTLEQPRTIASAATAFYRRIYMPVHKENQKPGTAAA